jgi:hypothetical protein
MAITTNMLLDLPVVGDTKGPTFGSLEVAALAKIDSHNHMPRRGVSIPSGGIAINADLSFVSFNATELRSLRLKDHSTALTSSDTNCLSQVDGDFYFNNDSGTAIQITDGSTLNSAGIGSIVGDYGSGTESVYYTGSATKTPTKQDSWTSEP